MFYFYYILLTGVKGLSYDVGLMILVLESDVVAVVVLFRKVLFVSGNVQKKEFRCDPFR